MFPGFFPPFSPSFQRGQVIILTSEFGRKGWMFWVWPPLCLLEGLSAWSFTVPGGWMCEAAWCWGQNSEAQCCHPRHGPQQCTLNYTASVLSSTCWVPSILHSGRRRKGRHLLGMIVQVLISCPFLTRWPRVQCFSVWRAGQCWAIDILNTTSVLPSWLEAGGWGKKAQEYFEYWEVHEFNYTCLHQKVNKF